ncbi:MAG: diguanylate cyclase [Anaerolineae bacterium]|nr:diguanylate cyclase [Anaerolineae bacterium]
MKKSGVAGDTSRRLRRLTAIVFLIHWFVLGGLLWAAWPMLRGKPTQLVLTAAGVLMLAALQTGLLIRLQRQLAAGQARAKRTRLEQMFLDALLHDTRDSIYLKDREHRVILANDWMAESMGIPLDAVLGHDDSDLFGAAFGAETAVEEELIFTNGEPLVNAVESRDLDTGQLNWSLTTKVPVRVDGEIQAILGITREFGEIARTQESLAYAAAHDNLTGLLNRRGFIHALEVALAGGTAQALLFIDVDDFKRFNDTHGHKYGDAVLRAAAQRLQSVLRRDDAIGRYAGDEFVVLANSISSAADAQTVAHKVLTAFEQPLMVEDEPCQVSISIGVSCCGQQTASTVHRQAEEVIASADRAMYRVKQSGKHGVQVAGNE